VNHTKPNNALCEENAELLIVKAGGTNISEEHISSIFRVEVRFDKFFSESKLGESLKQFADHQSKQLCPFGWYYVPKTTV
jgi:hypothetical protein